MPEIEVTQPQTAAWNWLEATFGSYNLGSEDIAYDADDMVRAFNVATAAENARWLALLASDEAVIVGADAIEAECREHEGAGSMAWSRAALASIGGNHD